MIIYLRFNMGDVSCVYQTIEIPDNTFTKDEIIEGLNSRRFITSISRNGTINDLDTGFREVGKVLDCSHEHNLDYTDFQDCE